MSILITTYEGTHNHTLPVSATAMASTTSAAASMLLSGSSTSSGSGPSPSASATSFTSNSLNGLNFYLSDNTKPKPFYLPNSSLSSSTTFPTITLDLTTNPSAASHLSKLSTTCPPRYHNSATNLNFSSLDSNSLPTSWSSYGTHHPHQPYNNTKNQTNSLSFGRIMNPQENLYQNYLQKHILSSQQQNLPSETIAAATKAITSDPSFPSVLAAALTSFINNNASGGGGGGGGALPNQNSSQTESFPVLSSFQSSTTTTTNANKCASSFLTSKNLPPSSSSSLANSQPGNFMFLSPSVSFPTQNGKSMSPGHENRDHV